MRTIGVVTGARSDYGIYLPVLRAIEADNRLRLKLIAAGMHLSPEFGYTVEVIERDGFEIADRVEMLVSADTPRGISKSMGLGTIGFAQVFADLSCDILLVLGDRFEMHAAVVAALPFAVPVAHIHGGESTEGLIDEPIRHSITKMSHIHFVSTGAYQRRVEQMGEEPWRVTVSGAPSLDNLRHVDLMSREELEQATGLVLTPSPILVTFHPVTLDYRNTGEHIQALLGALASVAAPVVFTYPNADTSGRVIIEAISEYVDRHEEARVVENLGTDAYFSLMSHASAMVGNSSSGIIEAASFQLPVVNIGNRQRGRVRGTNVIDVDADTESIAGGIRRAVRPDFRSSMDGLKNPYGDGHAAERIVERLKSIALDQSLIVKRFHDLSGDSI